MAHNNDDSFYDSVEAATQEYSSEAQSVDAAEQARREEIWRTELAKLEEEIGTLKSVLNAKVNEATELKRKLGITTIVELKEDLKHGIQAIKESETVQKTNEKLHQWGETIASTEAYQKTTSSLKEFGAFASRKMGDLKNSNAFKSVEGKVGGAYSSIKQSRSMGNIKTKLRQVSGSQSDENVASDLNSCTNDLTDLDLSTDIEKDHVA